MEHGRGHLREACKAYERPLKKPNRFFLHEHPWGATSWSEPEVQKLMNDERVYVVKGPMCRWKMKVPGANADEYVKKETGWMTNHKGLAELLQGECDGQHRHVHLVDGLAKYAQVYPPRLVSAILKTVAQTIHSEHVPVQAFVESGPVPEVHGPMETEEYKECWDDVNGGYLNAEMVAAARQDELKWVDKQQLLEQVPTKMCYEETGRAPITLK